MNNNTENTDPNKIEASPEAKRKGRPLGFRSRFRLKTEVLNDPENRKYLNLLKGVTMKGEQKIPRTPEEITALFNEATDAQKSDPNFLLSLPVKVIPTGQKVDEVLAQGGDDIVINRSDVIAFFQSLQSTAIQFLADNDEGE
jgi:hypothetical protein